MKWIKCVVIILLVVCAFVFGARCNIEWIGESQNIEVEKAREENVCMQNKLAALQMESDMIDMYLAERNALEKELSENREKIAEIDKLWDNVTLLRNRLREQADDDDRAVVNMILDANETYYKMFYGKWCISSMIGNADYDEEKASDFIGRIVEYSSADIKVDGKKVVSVPAYAYGIFPTEKQDLFFQLNDLENPFINMQADFFIYISVETQSKGDAMQDYIFKQFFVVNDNMLILDADGTYFVMERLAYQKNHSYEMTIPDYYW